MLFYKPETYLLPSPRETGIEPVTKIINPTKGLSGNPAIPPTRQFMIQKQGPFFESKPKFIRDHLSNNDIEGCKPKPLYTNIGILYQGRNKSTMLTNLDIEGSSPARVKARDLDKYNIFDYSDVSAKSVLRSSMRSSILPPPEIKIKRPNGESFYMKTNGDLLMRSSQSSRLADPMNTSGVIDPKFSTSSMVYYPHRKRLDEMGEIIKAKTNFVLPNIRNPSVDATSRVSANIVEEERKSNNYSKLNQSTDPSASSKLPDSKFHDRFRNKDKGLNGLTKSFEMINSTEVNNKLRTRPAENKFSTLENSDFVPLKGYNLDNYVFLKIIIIKLLNLYPFLQYKNTIKEESCTNRVSSAYE